MTEGPSNRCVHKGTKLCFFMCLCVSVCVFLMDAQTVRPIVSKLGIVIEGHLAGNIGLVSWAYLHGGLRERRWKWGGVSFGSGRESFVRSWGWEFKLREQQLLTEREKNKIAQGDVNIFCHLKFSFISTFLLQRKKNFSKLIYLVTSIFRDFPD